MRFLKISLLVFILSITISGQVPDTLWTKIFGSDTSEDWGFSFVETDDKGFIIAGATLYNSPENIWIFKTDQDGNLEWTKQYGNPNYLEQARMIKKTNDSNYVVVGTKQYSYFDENIWLLKINNNGDTIWTKTYLETRNDFGWAIEQNDDNGYTLLGVANLDLVVIKTDSLGQMIWKKYYENTATIFGYEKLTETFDKNYVLLSTVEYQNSTDIMLQKINEDGNIIWRKTYGGSGNDWANGMIESSDGGYVITGYANPPISNHFDDLWVFKTDSAGVILWSKTFGTDTTEENGENLIEPINNNFLVVGERTVKYGQWLDIWILRIDESGDTIWTKTLGGNRHDISYDILETNGGEYLVLGWTGSFGFSNVWLIKLEGEPSVIETRKELNPYIYKLSQNYPNPFNPTTKISFVIGHSSFVTLKVYDVLGNEVSTLVNEEKLAGEYEVEFDGSTLPSGVYLYQLRTDNKVFVKKMLLLK